MSDDLVRAAEAAVDEKVQAGEMFTAHDVTVAVRGRLGRADHEQVKAAVHDYYNRGGMGIAYTREPVALYRNGTLARPFLYHRSADDVSQYSRTDAPAVTTTPATFASPMVRRTKPGVLSDRPADARQSLSIPATLVRNIGARPGQTVYATPDNNAVVVSMTPPPGTSNTSYTVDCHGQIRLTRRVLRQAGVLGTTYDLEQDGQKILVKSHA